jgi:hypothetical protein
MKKTIEVKAKITNVQIDYEPSLRKGKHSKISGSVDYQFDCPSCKSEIYRELHFNSTQKRNTSTTVYCDGRNCPGKYKVKFPWNDVSFHIRQGLEGDILKALRVEIKPEKRKNAKNNCN